MTALGTADTPTGRSFATHGDGDPSGRRRQASYVLRTIIGAGILAIRDHLTWCASQVSYDLHITRALSWLEVNRYPISREEWNEYARRHPAMVEDGWVQWSGGEVVVTGPVDGYIEELVAIAEALDAKVIDEDGQRYTRDDIVDCPRLR